MIDIEALEDALRTLYTIDATGVPAAYRIGLRDARTLLAEIERLRRMRGDILGNLYLYDIGELSLEAALDAIDDALAATA